MRRVGKCEQSYINILLSLRLSTNLPHRTAINVRTVAVGQSLHMLSDKAYQRKRFVKQRYVNIS